MPLSEVNLNKIARIRYYNILIEVFKFILKNFKIYKKYVIFFISDLSHKLFFFCYNFYILYAKCIVN